METRSNEEIHDWYDAIDKIAEEAKQTGVSSSRQGGIESADFVQMSDAQRELIAFLWVEIQHAALLRDENDDPKNESLQRKFWTTELNHPKLLTKIIQGALTLNNVSPLLQVQLLLLAILRKSGISLENFYDTFKISKENSKVIATCLDSITNTLSDCVDQLGIALRESLRKLKKEDFTIKFSFESSDNHATILDNFNKNYFHFLADCAGAFISPAIKQKYLKDVQGVSAIIISPPHIGSGGCSRSAIAMGLLYMAYRAINDENFAKEKFAQESIQQIAKTLKLASQYNSPISKRSFFQKSSSVHNFTNCASDDKQRIEKIEEAIADYTGNLRIYDEMVDEMAELFMNGFIPEELRPSLLLYCSDKTLHRDIQTLLMLENINDNEAVKKELHDRLISREEIKELLKGYFTAPATPWLPDELTQKIIEILGGDKDGWLVPNEVKIANANDIAKYNLPPQHTHVIFANNSVSQRFINEFEGRNILIKDASKVPKLNTH